MTYLLTEIALEMLGYKFYDIDGVPGPINFSNNETPPPDLHSNEPNLADILLNENLAENQMSQDLLATSQNQLEDDSPVVPIETNNQSSAEVLALLLDAEYEKICKEILEKKKVYPVINSDLCGRIDKPKGVVDLRRAFIDEELQNLFKEVNVMNEFKKLIEEVSQDLNPIIYKQYTETFQNSQNKT